MARGVGFNHQFKFFEELINATASTKYPPYNIIQTSDEEYQLEFAVAGFSKDDISIEASANLLTVKGEKNAEHEGTIVHKGIADRSFDQSFPLAEYVEVSGAELKDGMLTVYLTKKIPDALKTKAIKIK
jgi:molecular chaperone IbpA